MQQHLATLADLYNRATDAGLTHERIEATVGQIGAALDARGAVAMARAFGVTRQLRGRADAVRRILHRIAERKGRHERGEAIAALAR